MPQSRFRSVALRHSARAGFTTLELLIAMSVTLVLVAVAAPIYTAQSKAVNTTAGRTDATRSATFATDAIEQDLRNTGVGVFDAQPLMVRGAVDAISFNANMVTARATDIVAVFFDPDADSTALGALSTSTSVTLPNSATTYPTANYISNAETISYYTKPDTGASPISGGTRVILYRKVNRQAEEVVAKNLVKTSTLPMFQYARRNLAGVLSQVPSGSLPMYHSVARHGAAADTGAAAVIDSIAMVRVTLIAFYRDPRGATVVDTVQRDIRIANAGLLQRSQCGETPLAPGAPALAIQLIGGLNAVRMTWSGSGDELAGERDVEMYAVYRRVNGTLDWGEPIANVPGSGTATVTYTDDTVNPLVRYDYALSALDCTPAPSALSPAVNILVP